MSQWIHRLLLQLKEGLRQIYADNLSAVYLFGSYARGEEDLESDVDVVVVLNRFEHYGAEVNRTSELTAKLSLEYGVSISKVFFNQKDWKEAQTPFLANVREEAVSA
jgi:predicted nucleotidyltransferase